MLDRGGDPERRKVVYARESLRVPAMKEQFSRTFFDHLANYKDDQDDDDGDGEDVDRLWNRSVSAMQAAQTVLPTPRISPNRPWISEQTMDLVDKRKVARLTGDVHEERKLRKVIRASAKKDTRSG